MNKMVLAAVLLATTTGAGMAQDEAAAAKALLLPMLQETAPGKAGEVLTDCVIASAQPQELTAFATAPAPSIEVGASITAILARPEAIACMTAATE